MNVLVDTSVWSLGLRRTHAHLGSREQATINLWTDVVRAGDAVLIGPIRQEVLSGIRSRSVFEKLADRLADFPDLELIQEDYVRAAEFYNTCRSKGVVGTPIDLLICAAASRHETPILTTDADFERYASLLPIRLV